MPSLSSTNHLATALRIGQRYFQKPPPQSPQHTFCAQAVVVRKTLDSPGIGHVQRGRTHVRTIFNPVGFLRQHRLKSAADGIGGTISPSNRSHVSTWSQKVADPTILRRLVGGEYNNGEDNNMDRVSAARILCDASRLGGSSAWYLLKDIRHAPANISAVFAKLSQVSSLVLHRALNYLDCVLDGILSL